MQYFKFSLLFTLLGLTLAFWWGGAVALSFAVLLAILEISLSFDNAIVNASILHTMQPLWQRRFFTWGILIAVFLIRLVLPVCIVALLTHSNLSDALLLAIQSPGDYSKQLIDCRVLTSTFGGLFLLLVSCSFFFHQNTQKYWLNPIEKIFMRFNRFKFSETIFALIILFTLQTFIPHAHRAEMIISGLVAIALFTILTYLTNYLNQKAVSSTNKGIIPFLYLEILDASFSLDGIVGAFAITQDLIIILIGLAIGAIFVRSITLFLVHHGTIKKYLYLKHGAYYAIGSLGCIMLMDIFITVPGIITGAISFGLIASAFLCSKEQKK